jgi:hypothetical protein
LGRRLPLLLLLLLLLLTYVPWGWMQSMTGPLTSRPAKLSSTYIHVPPCDLSVVYE